MTSEQPPAREELQDTLEAILKITNQGGAAGHVIGQRAPSHLTWRYDRSRQALADLYRRGVRQQWNQEDLLPWDTPVDQVKLLTEEFRAAPEAYRGRDLDGTVFARWGEKEWVAASVELQNWTMSQFLHGEQGALVCAAKLVETVPWIDAKYFAASQVMDEARHVEIFSRYLDEKLSGVYPVTASLDSVLETVIQADQWDFVYLGMQTMVEGLALAAFFLMRSMTHEPLLKALLDKVITDEARHVAFGVLSLEEFYRELSASEIRQRQEFALEAVLALRDRYLHQEAWERLGVPRRDVATYIASSPDRELFQNLLLAKIVPQCKRIGLMDAGDGWLRKRFDELNVSWLEALGDGTGGLGELEHDATAVLRS